MRAAFRMTRILAVGLLLLLLDGEASAKKKKASRGTKKTQPPEGLPGGPGGRGRGPPGMGEPYVDPKTVPDPEPDPTAFLVDFEIEGTVGGAPRQPLGTFTLKVSPNWAPIGVARMRLVRVTTRLLSVSVSLSLSRSTTG